MMPGYFLRPVKIKGVYLRIKKPDNEDIPDT
jgi:hypothetical protein